ncbi:MAG: hypothetical protein ACW99G_10275 [Candidatus Thorarchaeota archaeon]|jgi:recombination protein RecA
MAKKEKKDETNKNGRFVVNDKEQKDITKFLIKELNRGQEMKTAFSLNDPNPTDVTDYISTGSTILDMLIANKAGDVGIPCGKLTEIVGEEASGKSLLATQILAEAQRKGGIAVYLDTEYAASPDFMERLGINRDKLVYMNPGSIENCYGAIEKTITMARTKDTKCPVVIVWDSIAATPPQCELDGDYDPNSRIGVAAKAHAKGLRKLQQTIGNDKVTLVFTNQLKVKIGVMFGDPMGTPGGKAIPYHADVRIKLTKSTGITEGVKQLKETMGFRTLAKVFKNRLGPPMRQCEFNILFTSGVDNLSSIRDYLHLRGVIKKSAGWMKMAGPDGQEMKFRAGEFAKMMEDKKFFDHVHAKLDEVIVKKYDGTDGDVTEDTEIDTDSVLEMEQIAAGN